MNVIFYAINTASGECVGRVSARDAFEARLVFNDQKGRVLEFLNEDAYHRRKLAEANPARAALRHHVTGAVERGEKEPIAAKDEDDQ